ncbi:hypothetical protein [Pseudomonas sp. Irchel 3E20]|uniref:hypothetical protein n=1 Tax=Pseudomonas sp. Irchel 3E20 TaxID=2008983 RepID=UPI002114AC4D|nr:hypothetical protein [Pseudomonas sp. Irchel 3E20]
MIAPLRARLHRHWQRARAGQGPRVDFQRQHLAHKGLVAVLWLLALVLAFIAWQHWQALQAQQRHTDELEQHFVQLARQQERLIQAAIRTTPQQKKQLALFAEQALTPFPLLDTLGQAWLKEVAVTRVEVNTLTRELNLDLEARVLRDAFRFVERLKAQPNLAVSLQQSARKPNDPARPVVVKLNIRGQ